MDAPLSAPAVPTPAEVLYRLSLVKSFVDEVQKDITDDDARKLSSVVAAQVDLAIARVQYFYFTSTPQVPPPAAHLGHDESTALDAIRTLSSEASLLRRQAPTNALLLQYCALLELCPFLFSNGTINIDADSWRRLSNRLPVFAVVSSLITSGKLSFPYKRFDFGSLPQTLFANLQSLDHKSRIRKSNHKFVVPNHHPSRLFPFTFDKSFTLIVAKDEDYEDADKLVRFWLTFLPLWCAS